MNKNITYPEIYLSKEIEMAMSGKPQLPEEPKAPLKPVVPSNPGEYDSGGNRGCFLFVLIGGIVTFFAVMSSDFENKGSLILPGIGFIACAFFLFKTTSWDKESHEKKKEEYNKMKNNISSLELQYQKDYSEYLKRKNAYDSEVKTITSNENIVSYRQNHIESWLEEREDPDYLICDEMDDVKKGASENYFFELLSKHFDEVYSDVKVPVGNTAYYPDFLLIVDSLFIDIEIDEPYAGNDGTPIHYYTSDYGLVESIDEDRNNYMTDSGFEVIRFSEEQIFLHSDECINYIKNVVNCIKSADKNIQCDQDFMLNKWTKEQASRLAYQRFRNTYVPLQYQRYIAQEDSRSYSEMRSEIE